MLMSHLTTRWMTYLEALLDVCEERGNGNVPFKFTTESKKDPTSTLRLGRWLCDQRSSYRKKMMRPHRERLLQILVKGGYLLWDSKESSMDSSRELFPKSIQKVRSELKQMTAATKSQETSSRRSSAAPASAS